MQIGITEAAKIAEMTEQNLRYLIDKGKGPMCGRDHANRRIFDDSTVRSWYKEYKKAKKLSRSKAR